MRLPIGKICLSGVTAGLLISGAGAAFISGAAANAATAPRPAAGVHHVSPFGLHARRSVRHLTRRPGAAAAVSPAVTTTEWVSNSAAVGSNTSCASPGFSTISGALAAAPSGSLIKVCTGTYGESLAITRSVTLKAVGPVTVIGGDSPSASTICDADGGSQPNEDVVDICGTPATATNTAAAAPTISVTITGFTVQGNWPADACNDSLYGVAVLGGAKLAMSATAVENIGGSAATDGCQGGVGIEVGLATSATSADPGTATLTNDNVSSYQKNGITVDGAGSSASIKGTIVTGAGETPAIAQNGIQVSDGATSTISGSTVTGNECDDTSGGCGPDALNQTQAAGILAFDSGKTTVSDTSVSGNDLGVYNLEDYPTMYYTPPSPFRAVPVSFTALTLANRYENAGFDEGTSSISGSSLSGGEVGLEVFQYAGDGTTPKVTATGDTITGASADAVLVASDNTSGDKPVNLSVTGSSFDSSNAAGVGNTSTSVVTATGDWWGDATGPSVWSFGTGTSVSPDVNFFPWATDSALSGTEGCTSGNNETTAGNDVVLCAPAGTSNAFLENNGTGNVLLLGNSGSDQLVGSSGGETWMIGGNPGSNVFNGRGGTGYIQKRGNHHDTVTRASRYTIAAK